jgi:hypothetical protein
MYGFTRCVLGVSMLKSAEKHDPSACSESDIIAPFQSLETGTDHIESGSLTPSDSALLPSLLEHQKAVCLIEDIH